MVSRQYFFKALENKLKRWNDYYNILYGGGSSSNTDDVYEVGAYVSRCRCGYKNFI